MNYSDRAYRKAMNQCLQEHRENVADHTPETDALALHRAGYPAGVIAKYLGERRG